MVNAAPDRPGPATTRVDATWGVWLAWTWVLLILLCALAELSGLESLRLALDLQRHF